MSFIEAIKTCFAKYVTFSGRARRSEHWYFFLFIILVMIVLVIWLGSTIMGPVMEYISEGGDPNDKEAIAEVVNSYRVSPSSIVLLIFWVGTLLPTIAVQIRRMHDIGRSGWWSMTYWTGVLLMYAPFIPTMISYTIFIIGTIWFIYLACQDSTPGDNVYGPNPKGLEEATSTNF
ncbi:MAG: DUF805 domain-containing protein [Bacteroidales bacterium]|nr:DUF805 domain-containing protein [Bacteroidales bacterium]